MLFRLWILSYVLQWVTRSIDNYMRQLLKKYKQRDRELQEQLTTDPMHPVQLSISDEVYILQKYRRLILSNQSNIRYHSDPRMDQHFHVLMNTYDYEDWLFSALILTLKISATLRNSTCYSTHEMAATDCCTY